MIASMINGDPDPEDIQRYFRALTPAQRDIDLRPELYTHYYKNEFPDRFHAAMDTRRWGPGERIVFEPYSREVFEQSFDWIAKHEIFEAGTWATATTTRRPSRSARSEGRRSLLLPLPLRRISRATMTVVTVNSISASSGASRASSWRRQSAWDFRWRPSSFRKNRPGSTEGSPKVNPRNARNRSK